MDETHSHPRSVLSQLTAVSPRIVQTQPEWGWAGDSEAYWEGQSLTQSHQWQGCPVSSKCPGCQLCPSIRLDAAERAKLRAPPRGVMVLVPQEKPAGSLEVMKTVSCFLPVFPTFKAPKQMNPHILFLLKENISILFSINIIFNAKEFGGVETNQKNKHNNLMPVPWNLKLMYF